MSKKPSRTDLYAAFDVAGGFKNFQLSALGVRMCGISAEDVVRVQLIPDDAGAYWCWHDYERDEYSMVWPSFVQLDMCFPYGIGAAEKQGRGTRVRVRAELWKP